MKTIAQSLAELASSIRYGALPAEVVAETKRRLLDAVGCALAGHDSGPARAIRHLISDLGGRAESTVFGERARTSCEKATLANSTMLRYLDYMDSHAGPDPCHPCFNIPACLAVAERAGASGRALIEAIVTGYEIHIRFQESAGDPDIGSRGWFSGTHLQFSVPLAAGKLLGLDPERLTHAVAIAATHSNSLNALSRGSIPSSKSIADGMIAANAVVAALLAERGITGPQDIMESRGGFIRAVAGKVDGDRLLAPVQTYRIMEVNTKYFNTIRMAQTAVAGALRLVQEHGLKWTDLASVTVYLPTREHASHEGIWNDPSRLRPQNRDSANHSIAFSLAAGLVDGELGPEQYREEKLRDPDVLSLVDKISLQADPALDAHWPKAAVTRVALRARGGKSYEATTLYPPGHHRNPLTDEQLNEKFRRLAKAVLSAARAQRVIETVARLDELSSAAELTRQLRPH
ncbi:MAG TPA: MmgE/PrpD family protein [Candidatus Acidoferrales bacterium]|nr:MmgE/PrpD family protein [Candidatus Acidoferrales bacterium]